MFYDKNIIKEITLGMNFFNNRDFVLKYDGSSIKIKARFNKNNKEQFKLRKIFL